MLDNIPLKIAENLVRQGKLKISVTGQSMEPMYHSGDTILIEPAKELKIGDIVLLHVINKYVIHRIVYVNGKVLFTKGDNNKYMDFYAGHEVVVGKAVKQETGEKTPDIEMAAAAETAKSGVQFVYVFWNKEDYQACRETADKLSVKALMGNELYTDGVNIAILPTDLKTRLEKASDWEAFCTEGKKVYLHINAPISDHPQEGFVPDTDFDMVFRSGSFLMNYMLSAKEKFLVLLGEIFASGKEI